MKLRLMLCLIAGLALARAADFPITGGVAKQGTYRLDHDEGVIALILRADGFVASGCPRVTVLRKVDRKMVRVNVWEIMAEFQPDSLLEPGDTVLVSEHIFPCIGNEKALRELMEDYLKARAKSSTPPANWKERFTARIGGDGQRLYEGAKKGVRELPGK